MDEEKISVPVGFMLDDLIRVFERRASALNKRRAHYPKADATLPRVPIRVENLTIDGDDSIAHFLNHFENPPESIGTLTIAIPQSVQKSAHAKTKKPSRTK